MYEIYLRFRRKIIIRKHNAKQNHKFGWQEKKKNSLFFLSLATTAPAEMKIAFVILVRLASSFWCVLWVCVSSEHELETRNHRATYTPSSGHCVDGPTQPTVYNWMMWSAASELCNFVHFIVNWNLLIIIVLGMRIAGQQHHKPFVMCLFLGGPALSGMGDAYETKQKVPTV